MLQATLQFIPAIALIGTDSLIINQGLIQKQDSRVFQVVIQQQYCILLSQRRPQVTRQPLPVTVLIGMEMCTRLLVLQLIH